MILQSRLGQCEDKISDTEDRFAVNNQKKIAFIKLARDHEKSIQQLLNEIKKNNLRLTGVNEHAGGITNYTLKIFRYDGKKLCWYRKNSKVNQAYKTPVSHDHKNSTARQVHESQHKKFNARTKILKAV